MRRYSIQTLKRMLDRAETRYYELTAKPCGNWGDGMRLSRLPENKAWERARDRVFELRSEIEARKEEEMKSDS